MIDLNLNNNTEDRLFNTYEAEFLSRFFIQNIALFLTQQGIIIVSRRKDEEYGRARYNKITQRM